MDTKKLRKGITTGSCAAAAAKACALALFEGELLEVLSVRTPKGEVLEITTELVSFEKGRAHFFVKKDSGDDPDVTNGIEIHCIGVRSEEPGIHLETGKGIGIVTKPGLYVEVGQPAINPKPREMILENVREVVPKEQGIRLILSVPEGEEIAKKTYNPRLGILGGISILGTSGIVEPMSEDAIMGTIYLELRGKRALGAERAILVPGNYGESFMCREFGYSSDEIIKISNYVGFSLKACVELGYKEVLLAGHAGKMVKVAGGIWNTHSSICDSRMEILTAYLALLGMARGGLEKIMNAITTEEAIQVIRTENETFMKVFQTLANKGEEKAEIYSGNNLKVGIILFSMKELLAIGVNGKRMVEEEVSG